MSDLYSDKSTQKVGEKPIDIATKWMGEVKDKLYFKKD
jgi:hypothetical protein